MDNKFQSFPNINILTLYKSVFSSVTWKKKRRRTREWDDVLFVYDWPDLLQAPDPGTVLDLLLLPIKQTSHIKSHIHFMSYIPQHNSDDEFNSLWAGKHRAEAKSFRWNVKFMMDSVWSLLLTDKWWFWRIQTSVNGRDRQRCLRCFYTSIQTNTIVQKHNIHCDSFIH